MSLPVRLLRLGYVFALLGLPGSFVQSQPEADQQDQIESIDREIESTQALRTEKDRQRELLLNEVNNLRDEINRLKLQRSTLTADVLEADEGISKNMAQVNVKLNQVNEIGKKLVWGVVTSQQLEQRNPLAMLILENDPLKVDRLYNYHGYFLDYLDDQIDQHQQLLVQLSAERERIEASKASAERSRLILERNAETLNTRTERLASMESQLKAEVNQLDVDLAELQRQRQELTRLISERTRSSGSGTALPTPLSRDDISVWPVDGKIIQGYGTWRADGRIQTEGIVIGAARHAPVFAVANGTVVFSQWLEGYKNTLIVDHGDEVISVYAYCDTLLKEANTPVESGETIATVGVADQLNVSGLYFEIRVRNEASNPLDWLNNR